jgi:LysR family transcriptional regulator, hca operon transcriptional activator
MGLGMELRHLRYFVAVAEEGSLTVAAERRLHTAQPSLSRQIRDLEHEVGTQLLIRSARGVELTDAGRVFLDHARLALAQVEATREAARRAARPLKPVLAVGLLSVLRGQEVNWLAETTRVLGGDMRNVEMTVSSEHSPDLAEGLATGRLDVAFMRAELNRPDLDYITVAHEPFVVIMPSDHRLTAHDEVDVRELAGERFISGSGIGCPICSEIKAYLAANGLDIEPAHRVK